MSLFHGSFNFNPFSTLTPCFLILTRQSIYFSFYLIYLQYNLQQRFQIFTAFVKEYILTALLNSQNSCMVVPRSRLSIWNGCSLLLFMSAQSNHSTVEQFGYIMLCSVKFQEITSGLHKHSSLSFYSQPLTSKSSISFLRCSDQK